MNAQLILTVQTIQTIMASMSEFSECDYTHDLHRDGRIVENQSCEGGNEDCSYCTSVVQAADKARKLAAEAIFHLVSDDIERATRRLEEAVYIEQGFGDAVAYRPALRAIRELADAE